MGWELNCLLSKHACVTISLGSFDWGEGERERRRKKVDEMNVVIRRL